MTAVAAVAAFLIENVPRRGCAILYTKNTSSIACKFFVLFWWVGGCIGCGRVDGVRVGEVGGLVYAWGPRSLGLIRFRLNQIRVSKV